MSINIQLDEHFIRFIEAQLTSGRYASASDLVSNSLRLLEAHELQREQALQKLRILVQEGDEPEEDSIDADVVFDRLDAKYRNMLEMEEKQRGR